MPNPHELRHLCEQQEKLILAECKATKLDHEFYDFVREQLEGSTICHRILRIKEMSNEEAEEEFSRLQSAKGKTIFEGTDYSYENTKYSCDGEEAEEEDSKQIFSSYGRRISMWEDNDDPFLGELGSMTEGIQLAQEMEEEGEHHDSDYSHFGFQENQ
jgi:hypothetical protein